MDVSTTGTIIIAEIPVVSTALLAVIGWMINRLLHRIDDLGSDIEKLDNAHSDTEAQVGQLSMRLAMVERLADTHDRRLGNLGENLASLARFVESHERWHERHDEPHTRGG